MGGRESFLEVKFGPNIEGGVSVSEKGWGRAAHGSREGEVQWVKGWGHLVHEGEEPCRCRAGQQGGEAETGGKARCQGMVTGVSTDTCHALHFLTQEWVV